ncbi:site-2 protease family protein [Thermococcus sp. M39]|uniref:site-2 protease family protein n=1 Tax=unclassified Thermococcus TaxID=2627626 RepID=UPI00143ADB30|nr:site-2 protease family protein [Thermococcus sp. M39]NJE13733.1 site-2 protease family protein [Thermococcus sp. LS2]
MTLRDFRKQELEDLAVSYIVLLILFSNFELKNMPYVALAVLTAFVFHELAHRQVAKRYGYVAFYKRWDTGILIALLLGIVGKIIFGHAIFFAALGAVYIYAPYQYWEDREAEGWISLSGPLTNIIVGIVALILLKTLSLPLHAMISLFYTAIVNFWIAFFNLLPFPPLDGYKVLKWNAGYWAVAIGVAYILRSLV